ncbi:MAG TPA: family 78 glycoside hydrolase catalytic domain [Parafilimonas sp.]|nr:family 78 glycoside hydrolase catalytic domain [Parafilimonas sp.]
MFKYFIIFSICVIPAATFATSFLQPATLKCEYVVNPLGIDATSPRLSWTFSGNARNQYQSAYELIVSDNLKDVQQNNGVIWSTGKISSKQNIQIEYTGPTLKSFTRYYWRVKTYDQNNEASEWSAINWFETAMLNQTDWKAQWIGDGSKNPARDEDYYKDDRLPLFRKEFSTNKKIAAARLYISGLGYYEAYLNGNKIGNNMLDPGFTTYRKEVLYTTHDITSMLKKGNNVAGIMLGSGWWNPLPVKLFGRWDLRQYQQTGRPCVKAEIHIQYNDGSTAIIATDESWQTAPGPIIFNSVYLGEKYDARLEQKNWSNINADKSIWKNASVTAGPSGVLSAQMQPPIKITRIVKPVKIYEQGKDTFIVDMGQNFAGVTRIKVKGAAGTKINMRLGEDVWKDGSLNYMTSVMTQIKWGNGGPGAPKIAWQEDSYILKGTGVETWNPRFTFHGFRYVEITGWPGTPTLNDIEGLRMNSDLPQDGNFSCSDSQFNKLHEVIQWTFLSNVFSVQSDCPAREKMGYGADMVVSSNSFIYNYDMANFYTKAVTDFANEQRPEGGITEIAPFTGIADRGYGDDSGPLGWQLGFPFLQKQLYDFYGDKRIIEKNYAAFVKQMDFLQSKAVDDLFYWDIGDHEALDTKADAFSAACFYYHHAKLAEEFAGILHKQDDAAKYAKLAEDIKHAIINKYNVRNTGRFDNATQATQIFALWYDLAPNKDSVMKVLMNEFIRHNMHLATGIFSTKMMFDIFRENNRNDIAYTIAHQETYPGWLYMLNNGATTLWETWTYPESSPSQNHPMFGSIEEWFYRSLPGINPAAPGFEKIIIRPQPAGDLIWAKGSYRSVRGNIVSEWEKDKNTFSLHVVIPANTTALVFIPSTENTVITEGNATIKPLRYEGGYAVIETGSGEYNFLVK